MAKKLISYDDAAAAGVRIPTTVRTDLAAATMTQTNKSMSGSTNTFTNLPASSMTAVLADIPRFLVFSTTWPARPNDDRRTFFLGGATSTNAPPATNLRTFDVWIPAS